jgi:hypothetical protein
LASRAGIHARSPAPICRLRLRLNFLCGAAPRTLVPNGVR